MVLSRLDNSDPRYREAFGNRDIHQFVVCTDQNESVGRVIDGLADEAGHLRYLVVELDAAIAPKQVLLPIERFRVNSNARRLYLNGLSSTQVASLPAYDPAYENTRADRLAEPASDRQNGTTETIRLLEEQLTVNREKRKLGEVIVRKEIETRIVEVPVRREKLIVEQVGVESKQLASIDLGESHDSVEVREAANVSVPSVISGEFTSVRAASQFLQAIADQSHTGCDKVQVTLLLSDPKLQQVYQQWLERYSTL